MKDETAVSLAAGRVRRDDIPAALRLLTRHAATAPVQCPQCGGGGEEGYEPLDWWHGSGVNVVTWECRLCKGEGEVTPDRIAEWNDAEQDEP